MTVTRWLPPSCRRKAHAADGCAVWAGSGSEIFVEAAGIRRCHPPCPDRPPCELFSPSHGSHAGGSILRLSPTGIYPCECRYPLIGLHLDQAFLAVHLVRMPYLGHPSCVCLPVLASVTASGSYGEAKEFEAY